jgi:DNA-damage-inducible protein J
MTATTMVHVRVEEHIKTQAAQTFAAMGLTVSDGIRVFLTRVVAENALPFELKAPNATSRTAMQEAHQIIKGRRARYASGKELLNDLEKNANQ